MPEGAEIVRRLAADVDIVATSRTRELIEVHGSIASCSCLRCGKSVAREEVSARLGLAADGVPRCEECALALKPDVVLFGELLSAPALQYPRSRCS